MKTRKGATEIQRHIKKLIIGLQQMKSPSMIQREIGRLKAMAESPILLPAQKSEAYEAYHALRWAIGDVDTKPSTLIRQVHEAFRLEQLGKL